MPEEIKETKKDRKSDVGAKTQLLATGELLIRSAKPEEVYELGN